MSAQSYTLKNSKDILETGGLISSAQVAQKKTSAKSTAPSPEESDQRAPRKENGWNTDTQRKGSRRAPKGNTRRQEGNETRKTARNQDPAQIRGRDPRQRRTRKPSNTRISRVRNNGQERPIGRQEPTQRSRTGHNQASARNQPTHHRTSS